MDNNKKEWNKLVRDLVPEILKKQGISCDVVKVQPVTAYRRLLLRKLIEEAREVVTAEDEHLLEELGDIETVIDALLKMHNLTRKQLRRQQLEKDKDRGTFEKRIFLKTTEERRKQK